MKPTRTLWESQATLMADDTTLLASATAMHAHLIKSSFTPGLDLTIGDLTLATFTGSAALSFGTGNQITYYDAADGQLTLLLKDPAGGLHWICTVDPGSPETIYGVAITDNADAVLLGVYKLAQPITISAAGQGVDVPSMNMKFSVNYPG